MSTCHAIFHRLRHLSKPTDKMCPAKQTGVSIKPFVGISALKCHFYWSVNSSACDKFPFSHQMVAIKVTFVNKVF